MGRLAKLTLILLSVVFLEMQFVSTAATPRTSAPTGVHGREVIDPQVSEILARSCQDCHSNRTNWPWYGQVAPISWIISKHVSEGREKPGFSAWVDRPPLEGERMLICDAVSSGLRLGCREYTLATEQ